MAYTCFDAYSTCNCNCENPDGSVTTTDVALNSMEWDTPVGSGNCCLYTCSRHCSKSNEPILVTEKGTSAIEFSTPRPTMGAFRGADGKLLEGKQEILGVDVPKVLVVAGVAVAAYFIIKKVK